MKTTQNPKTSTDSASKRAAKQISCRVEDLPGQMLLDGFVAQEAPENATESSDDSPHVMNHPLL